MRIGELLMKGGLEIRRGLVRWEVRTEGTLGLSGIAEDCNGRDLGERISSWLTDQRLGG